MASAKLSKRIGKRVLSSALFQSVAGTLIAYVMRFIHASNRRAKGAIDVNEIDVLKQPVIIALWHGQHLMAPCFKPNHSRYTALLSRSKDAEINARIVQKFDIDAVRGSGGRQEAQRLDKGGAKAFLSLRRALQAGGSVVVIADISKSHPRQAGRGVMALAKASNCPIIPMACAYSRRKVLRSTWDKTTIPLPFGQFSVVAGTPICVDKDASDKTVEMQRRALDDALNAATQLAYAQADGQE